MRIAHQHAMDSGVAMASAGWWPVCYAKRHKRQRTGRFPLGYVAVAWIYGKLVKNIVPISQERSQKNIIPAHSRDDKLEKQLTAK